MLLIPISVGMLVYVKTFNTLEEESKRANMAILQQTKLIIDSWMQEVEQLAKQVILNKRVNNFARIKGTLTTADIYSMIGIMNDLLSYKSINSFIDDFYIFFINSDVILTPTGKYDTRLFYNNIYALAGKSYKEWYQAMWLNYYWGEFLNMPTVDLASKRDSNEMLTYIKSMYIYRSDKPDAQIVILINKNKIKELLSNVVSSGKAYIIDKNDHVVMASDNEQGYIPKYKELKNSIEGEPKSIKGADFNIVYASSANNNWKYMIVIPRSIYIEKINYIRTLTTWVVAFCLVVGLFISYFSAYKTYVPIKEILNNIIVHLGGSIPHIAKNEIAFIQQAVTFTISENKELKNRLKRYLPTLKTNFLRNLLEGKAGGNDIDKEMLDLYEIDFISDSFVVALFFFNAGNELVQGLHQRDRKLIKNLEASFKNGVIVHNNRGYIFNMGNDTIALIMNFEPQKKFEQKREELEAAINDVKTQFEKYYQISSLVCVGDVHEGINGINLSYIEALKAAKYKLVKGSNGIIFYDEICNMEEIYYYPLEMEMQLINYIKAGDSKKAEKLIDTVIEQNLIKHRLSVELLQCLYFDIVSTVIKAMNEMSKNYEMAPKPNVGSLSEILECDSISEIRDVIKDICDKVSVYKNQYKQYSRLKLKQDIIKYIEEHYLEQGLNQVAISENVGISPSYLSHFFKNEFGESMVDYINRMRINRAKQILMEDKSISLKHIASLVGFNSDKALIRIFKKYEGVTPGAYREMLLFYK